MRCCRRAARPWWGLGDGRGYNSFGVCRGDLVPTPNAGSDRAQYRNAFCADRQMTAHSSAQGYNRVHIWPPKGAHIFFGPYLDCICVFSKCTSSDHPRKQFFRARFKLLFSSNTSLYKPLSPVCTVRRVFFLVLAGVASLTPATRDTWSGTEIEASHTVVTR